MRWLLRWLCAVEVVVEVVVWSCIPISPTMTQTRTETVAKSQELVLEKKVVREEVVEVIVEKEEDGEWWEAEITVPADAVALNFVVRYHATWDNNYGRDYKVRARCCVLR